MRQKEPREKTKNTRNEQNKEKSIFFIHRNSGTFDSIPHTPVMSHFLSLLINHGLCIVFPYLGPLSHK